MLKLLPKLPCSSHLEITVLSRVSTVFCGAQDPNSLNTRKSGPESRQAYT